MIRVPIDAFNVLFFFPIRKIFVVVATKKTDRFGLVPTISRNITRI